MPSPPPLFLPHQIPHRYHKWAIKRNFLVFQKNNKLLLITRLKHNTYVHKLNFPGSKKFKKKVSHLAIYAGRPFPPIPPMPTAIIHKLYADRKRKGGKSEAKVRSCILHTLERGGGLKSFTTLRRWSVFVLAPAENATRFFSWALLNQEDCWLVSQLAPGFFCCLFLGKRVSWWWCNLQCAQWSCFAKKRFPRFGTALRFFKRSDKKYKRKKLDLSFDKIAPRLKWWGTQKEGFHSCQTFFSPLATFSL